MNTNFPHIFTFRYKEVCDYDFKTGQSKGGQVVGHFTQIVWKTSGELGIGKSTKEHCIYVVARYRPSGNWVGQENENVLEGSYDPSFCENLDCVHTMRMA